MHSVRARRLLSAQNTMNLYRGCSHGCIYCDSRSACYHFEHPFEDIEVKENALELLEHALRNKRHPCMIHTGAMCDPYISAELRLRQTRGALELIDRYGFGISIQTKSDRILRDLDLLQAINAHAKAVVQMTLTTLDAHLCRLIEPNVCNTQARIEVLRAFQSKGIPTVVWLSPILPFINDTPENINGIIDACIETGVRGILNFGMGLTLREGNREYFYGQLDRHFPGMKRRYADTFGNAYECLSPRNAELSHVLQRRCREHDILCNPDEIFRYLSTFETLHQQLTLFDS